MFLGDGKASFGIQGKTGRQIKFPQVETLPDAVVEPFGRRVGDGVRKDVSVVIARVHTADRLVGHRVAIGGFDRNIVFIDTVVSIIVIQQRIERCLPGNIVSR